MNSEDEISSLSAICSNLGYECYPVKTVKTALRRLENEPYNLVLFDTRNAENPKEFLESLSVTYPDAAVVLVLDGSEVERFIDMVQYGADTMLIRPYDSTKMAVSVTLALEKRRLSLKQAVKIDSLERELETSKKAYTDTRQELDQNNIDTIKTFVGLLETRYHYLGSHSKRVATFCRAISERLDLNERIRKEIEIGALLHDIGKIAVPDILLQKTRDYFSYSQLTKKEQSIIRKHPIVGQEAVDMIEMLKHVGEYIRHHHERFDGKGYPDGLKGRFIPLGARIICVADAYDRIVISADKLLQKNARDLFLKFLDKQTGIIFDPEAAHHMNLFIRELESKEFSSERRVDIDELEPGMVLSRDIFTKSGVLLISQFERITPKDMARIKLFHKSGMIMGVVYIYGSPKKVDLKEPKTRIVKKSAGEKLEILTFAEVCEKIDTTTELSTLPTVYSALMSKMSDPKTTRDDIADILKQDQVVVAKLLRVVNSPLFGFKRSITTIEDAIPLLGFNEIRNIVTSLTVLKAMSDMGESESFDLPLFWKHSIGCAVISEIIAKKIGADTEEEYFTSGLLHDIGRLVLFQIFPENFAQMMNLMDEESMFLRQAERAAFGQSHQYVGEYLLKKWKLPDLLTDAVRNHHSPMDSEADPVLVSAVHVADIITHMLDIGKSGENTVPKLDGFAERKLGITLSDFELLVPDIDEKMKESEELLSLGGA